MKHYFTLTPLEMSVMLGYARKYAEHIGFNKIDKSSWKSFIKAVESGKYKDLVRLFQDLRQVEEWGCNGKTNAFSLADYQTPTDVVFLDTDELVECIGFFYAVLSNSIEFSKKDRLAGNDAFFELFEEHLRQATKEPTFTIRISPMSIAFSLLFKTKSLRSVELEKEDFDAVLSEARHIDFKKYDLLKKALLGNKGYSFMALPITIRGLSEPTYAFFLNVKGSIYNISSYFYNGGRKESMLFGYNGFSEDNSKKVHQSLVSSSQFLWESPSGIVERMGRRIFGDIKINPSVISLDHYSFAEEVLAPSILLGGVK